MFTITSRLVDFVHISYDFVSSDTTKKTPPWILLRVEISPAAMLTKNPIDHFNFYSFFPYSSDIEIMYVVAIPDKKL